MSDFGGLILGVAGAAVGSFFGFPGLGFALGQTLGGVLFPPENRLPDVEGPRLNDLRVQASTYGTPIPEIWGVVRLAGNVIWSTGIVETVNRETLESGGKGGPSQTQQRTTYTYSSSLAIGLCEGEILAVTRIWADGKLVYDKSVPGDDILNINLAAIIAATQDRQGKLELNGLRLYPGSETQTPDPSIEAAVGVGNAPAHRGLAYIVFDDLQLERYGNRIPNFEFEVLAEGTAAAADIFTVRSGLNPVRQTKRQGGMTIYSCSQPWTLVDIRGSTLVYYAFYSTFDNTRVLVDRYVVNLSTGQLLLQEDFDVPLTDTGTLLGWTALWTDCSINFPPDPHHIKPGPIFNPLERYPGTDRGNFIISPYQDNNWIHLILDWQEVNEGDINLGTIGGWNVETPPGYGVFVQEAPAGGLEENWLFFVWRKQTGAPVGEEWHIARFKFNRDTSSFVNPELFLQDDAPFAGSFSEVPQFAYGDGYLWLYSGDAGLARQFIAVDPVTLQEVARTTTSHYNNHVNFWVKDGRITFCEPTGADLAGPVRQYTYSIAGPNITMTPLRASVSTLPSPALTRQWLWPFGDEGQDFWLSDGFTGGLGAAGSGFMELGDSFTRVIAFADFFLRGNAILKDVVTDICDRVNLVPADIDVAQLTDTVRGYIRTRPMTGRAAIEPLMAGYIFDGVESDYLLKFVKRGQPSVALIEADQLAAHEGGDEVPDDVEPRRTQDLELPRETAVKYYDFLKDYQQGFQYARRLITPSNAVDTVDLPIVFTPDEGRRLADVLLYNTWQQRQVFTMRTVRDFVWLDPTDVVDVQDGNGNSYQFRLQDMEYSSPALITVSGVPEDTGIYTSAAEGAESQESRQDLPIVPDTLLTILDCGLLRSSDDAPGYYLAAGGLGIEDDDDPWPGVSIFRSFDAGESSNHLVTITSEATIAQAVPVPNLAGNATQLLPPPVTPTVWDELNVLTVDLSTGAGFENKTRAEVENGANAIAFFDNAGQCEILGFTTAVEISPGRWELSDFLRGRRCTENHMDHTNTTGATSGTVVLLDPATIRFAGYDQSLIGVEQLLTAPTIGLNILSAAPRKVTPIPANLVPCSPVDILGEWDEPAASDITIDWTRRSRTGQEWLNGADAQLGETTEEYELDIYQTAGFGTIVRAVTGLTSPTYVYTAADQTTDFGSAQTEIYVRIYQISSIVGRGDPGEAILAQ